LRKSPENLEGLAGEIVSSPAFRDAVQDLIRAIGEKGTTPAQLYTAERGVILAVEHAVKSR
jgi:hypothetical protein